MFNALVFYTNAMMVHDADLHFVWIGKVRLKSTRRLSKKSTRERSEHHRTK